MRQSSVYRDPKSEQYRPSSRACKGIASYSAGAVMLTTFAASDAQESSDWTADLFP
jgi:hypothetical protein